MQDRPKTASTGFGDCSRCMGVRANMTVLPGSTPRTSNVQHPTSPNILFYFILFYFILTLI